MTGRREDRLLFDHQIRLARLFGYEDASYTLAVEQFMQRYYRTAMFVSWLNELLLQHFREEILADRDAPTLPLSRQFQERDEFLEVTGPDVFARLPSALLELFLVLQQNPRLRGVRANTIRLVTQNLWLIDEEFRQNPRNHRLFLEILQAPAGVTHELRRMNLYGVLGRYIPAFGRIVGRMQYDLFHAYTVDAHTLFVVANLRRFALERYDHEFPKLAQIFRALPKPELAYLAAIFHDIAKGRGGDHSELGAVDAEAFCLEQGLTGYDARLVAWLVRHHLRLSVTSQKQDIADPQIVNAFAREVGDQVRLDYLYVLTVADVRGTNPKLWNSWKATLFDELYERVKQALRRGLESPLDREQLIAATQAQARELLAEEGIDAGRRRPRLADADRRLLPATFRGRDRLAYACARRPRRRRRGRPRRDRRTSGTRRRDRSCSFTRSAATTASRARPRRSTRWASASRTRASRRPPTAAASTAISCSKTPACRSSNGSAWRRSSASLPGRSPIAVPPHPQ